MDRASSSGSLSARRCLENQIKAFVVLPIRSLDGNPVEAATRRDRPDGMSRDTLRAVLARALGSALLSAAVVGSGIMAERLANRNVAIALLATRARQSPCSSC